jgi:hypothetical protein
MKAERERETDRERDTPSKGDQAAAITVKTKEQIFEYMAPRSPPRRLMKGVRHSADTATPYFMSFTFYTLQLRREGIQHATASMMGVMMARGGP